VCVHVCICVRGFSRCMSKKQKEPVCACRGGRGKYGEYMRE